MKNKSKINKFIVNIEKNLTRIIGYISIVLLFFISFSSLFFTTYFGKDYVEIALYKHDFFIVTLVFSLIFILIVWYLDKKIEFKKSTYITCLMIYTLFLGMLWINMSRSTPVSDQGFVSMAASQFLHGDYNLLNKGNYLYVYPFQLGIVGFIEIIYSIVGEDNYFFLMMLNVFSLCISFYTLYKISVEIFEDRKVSTFTTLLLFGCIPAIFYCTYVYGTLYGFMFALIGVYAQLRYYNTNKLWYAIISILTIVISIILKSNYLIVLIASVIMLFFKFLNNKKVISILLIIMFFVINSLASSMLFKYYEKTSGIEINDGAPKLLWIAMGLQEGDGAEGWYNEFNWDTYSSNNYDTEKSNEIALNSIKSSISTFIKNPIYAMRFFYHKAVSQWNEPTFQSIWGSHYADQHEGELSDITKDIYEGNLNKGILNYLNIYHFIIWFAALFYFIRCRREITIQKLFCMIIIIGGFLFHMFWEGKAQYILPYFIMVIPYSAAGIKEINNIIDSRILKLKIAKKIS